MTDEVIFDQEHGAAVIAHKSIFEINKLVFHANVFLETPSGREELLAKLWTAKGHIMIRCFPVNSPRNTAKHPPCGKSNQPFSSSRSCSLTTFASRGSSRHDGSSKF